MAGGVGWSKNGIGKSRRSRSRASTPPRFFRCCRIHFAGFSEKRPSRVLPTMTEMTVILLILAVRQKHDIAPFPNVCSHHRDVVDPLRGLFAEASDPDGADDHGYL